MTRQRRENKTCQFEVNSTLDWKPVQLAQHWRDVPVRLSVPSCAGTAAGLLPLAGGQETSTDSGGHPTAAAPQHGAQQQMRAVSRL